MAVKTHKHGLMVSIRPWMPQILAAVITLFAGGTAPWWWPIVSHRGGESVIAERSPNDANGLEKTAYNGRAAANSTAVDPHAPTCLSPHLAVERDERVLLSTPISWMPAHCPMVIEAWANRLPEGVPAGSKSRSGSPGRVYKDRCS